MMPTKRTKKVEDEILDRMSKGEPLANICRDEHMPSVQTWRAWCVADKALEAAHGRARDDGYEALAANTLLIATDGTNDWMARQEAREGQPAGWTFNAEHVQRSKLRVETILKLLACWDPRRYGNKVQNEHTGANGGPMQTLSTIDLSGATPEQLRAIASLKLGDKES
jgi:hypothetical protein